MLTAVRFDADRRHPENGQLRKLRLDRDSSPRSASATHRLSDCIRTYRHGSRTHATGNGVGRWRFPCRTVPKWSSPKRFDLRGAFLISDSLCSCAVWTSQASPPVKPRVLSSAFSRSSSWMDGAFDRYDLCRYFARQQRAFL
jgi:hypothetical protein